MYSIMPASESSPSGKNTYTQWFSMASDVLTYWLTGKNPQVQTQIQTLLEDIQPINLFNTNKNTNALDLSKSSRYLRKENSFTRYLTGAEGSEFEISNSSSPYVQYSDITTLVDGGFFVTWGYSTPILGQFFTNNGEQNGSVIQIYNTSLEYPGYPSVATLTNAELINVCGSIGNTYGQLYTTSGIKKGTSLELLTEAVYGSLSALTEGGFVISWEITESQDASSHTYSYSIYGQRYAASGDKNGTQFQINTDTTNYQNMPAVAGLSDGGFVVAWQIESQVQSSGYDVLAQRYSKAGNKNGTEFFVNTYTNSPQYCPDVAGFSDGGFVVVWQGYGQVYASYQNVYGQLYTADGDPIGGNFQISAQTNIQYNANCGYLSPSPSPKVATLANGGFVVVWQSEGQDGSGLGVFGQQYDANGATDGAQFQVNTYTDGDQLAAAVAGLSDGGYVVTWSSYGQDDPSSYSLYGQVFNANGTKQTLSPTAMPTAFPSKRPTQFPTRNPTARPTYIPTAPTSFPTGTPTAPTYAPTPFTESKFFPVTVGIVAGFASLLMLCSLALCLRYRKTKISTEIDNFVSGVSKQGITGLEMQSRARGNNPHSTALEEIKQDLLEQAKIIYLANRSMILFTSERTACHFSIAKEIYLLSKYFLTYPSIDAFKSYQKFIQDYQAIYAQRRTSLGKYSRQILDVIEFSSNDQLKIIEEKYAAQKTNPPSTALMLLLTLPHLQESDRVHINQKIAGVTLLHRIVGSQEETPLNLLCIAALLDCGATLIPADQEFQRMDITFQSPAHYAKRLNKTKFFAVLTNGADMKGMVVPLNATERTERAEEERIKIAAEQERKARLAEDERVRIIEEQKQKARREILEKEKIEEERRQKIKLEQEERKRAVTEQYYQILLKIARSAMRQLDINDPERQLLVQTTIHDFLKNSQEVRSASLDLENNSSHAIRRESLTDAIVSMLNKKKYLWNAMNLEKQDFFDELKTVILIWSQEVNEKTSDRSGYSLSGTRVITSSTAAMYPEVKEPTKSPLHRQVFDAVVDEAKDAAKEKAKDLTKNAIGAVFNAIF